MQNHRIPEKIRVLFSADGKSLKPLWAKEHKSNPLWENPHHVYTAFSFAKKTEILNLPWKLKALFIVKWRRYCW